MKNCWIYILVGFIAFSCEKNAPDPYKNGYPIDEVQFSYDDDFIISSTVFIIKTDKLCDTTNLSVLLNDQKAELIGVEDDHLTLLAPSYFNTTTAISITNKISTVIVKEQCSQLPGSLSFTAIKDGTFTERDYFKYTFTRNNKGYACKGYDYLGYNATTQTYNNLTFEDYWEFNPFDESWKEIPALDITMNRRTIDFFDTYESAKFQHNDTFYLLTDNHIVDWNNNTSQVYLTLNRINESDGSLVVLFEDVLNTTNYKPLFIGASKNKLFFGIRVFDDRESYRFWSYDLDEKATNFLGEVTSPHRFSELRLLMVHNSSLIFVLDPESLLTTTSSSIEKTPNNFYAYHIDQKLLVPLKVDNSIKSVARSLIFDFGDYAVIGEGYTAENAKFTSSNKLFKVFVK